MLTRWLRRKNDWRGAILEGFRVQSGLRIWSHGTVGCQHQTPLQSRFMEERKLATLERSNVFRERVAQMKAAGCKLWWDALNPET